MLDTLIGVVAPHSCVVCGREGSLLCFLCQPQAVTVKRSSCFICNRLTASWRVCSACRHRTKLRGVIVASYYDGVVKALIGQLKYARALAAAPTLAQLLAAHIEPAQFDLVTAVPPSSRRFRQRGYNQAQLIAKSLARLLKLPYQGVIGRIGQKRQVGTSRRERIKQIEGTMYVTKPRAIVGTRILVVDDVVTTGATMNECGRALKAAKARYIWGAAVAKH